MKKCCIFDLDGTILNTIDDLADSMNHTLRLYGLPTHTVRDITLMVGSGKKHFVQKAIPADKQELADEIYKISSEHYINNCTTKTKPYFGVVELLDSLKKLGCKLAVLTNKDQDSAIKTVHHYFGNNSFDVIFGALQGQPLKPNLATAQRVFNHFGIDNTDCILIGDSEIDIQTAKQSRIQSIAVSWGYRSRQVLEENQPDYLVDNIDQLNILLSELL